MGPASTIAAAHPEWVRKPKATLSVIFNVATFTSGFSILPDRNLALALQN
jgi:hypothetical protein